MTDKPQSNNPSPDADQEISGSPSFWSELKRRKVMRVAITYAVVAWLLIQIAATVFPQIEFPEWSSRFVAILLLTGFPVAIILNSFDEYRGVSIGDSAKRQEGRVVIQNTKPNSIQYE